MRMAHRIEMYLVSLKRQSVTLCGQRFDFAQGEAVHTEDSHKYTIESFREMAARAGFMPRAVWTDEDRLFSIHWLEIALRRQEQHRHLAAFSTARGRVAEEQFLARPGADTPITIMA